MDDRHGTPLIVLTAKALNPEALRKSVELGAKAYLPKDYLSDIVPFVEDVLTLGYRSVWRTVLTDVCRLFDRQFGPEWRKSEKEFWDEFDKRLQIDRLTVIES